MNNSKLNSFLSNLNFILCFVGYQFCTTIFLPLSSNSDIEGISRTVTVPYRIFALIISILVIIFNFNKSNIKTPLILKLFLFFWGILASRILYDLYIRTDISFQVDSFQLVMFIFGICIPAIISIINSYDKIDLSASFNWILILFAVTVIFSSFSNPMLYIDSDEITSRLRGNLALNTISFGHLGVSAIILALFYIQKKNTKVIGKILAIALLFSAFLIMVRSGSRSALAALLFISFIWIISSIKGNKIEKIMLILFIFLFLFIFSDTILSLMGKISPLFEDRLRLAIYEGNTNGRDELYKIAFDMFLDNPFLGKSFLVHRLDNTYIYSHNILLDAFMGLGILGGMILLIILYYGIKYSYTIIKNKDENYWIGFILLQQIIFNMFSSAFYYNQLLSALLTFVYLYFNKKHSCKF